MIKAVIFDMDGILLDSEPFWQDSEMEVFSTVGINLTREQCIETTGLPVRDVVAYRFRQYHCNKKTIEQVAKEIVDGVERRVRDSALPLEGAMKTVEFFRTRDIPIAIASSSSIQLINTVLKKLSIENAFQVIHSAENEEYGKPHPAVFLKTAILLDIDPVQCLVFEDSFNGLIAAKAARMKTVVIPMTAQWNETRFCIADIKLKSLSEFSQSHWNNLNTI
jgi:beta-phosphoglucomutase-like phosphatase (HAD superfamily)